MSIYSGLASVAGKLLTKYGQLVTLRLYTEGGYSEGQVTRTPTDVTLSGALFDFGDGDTAPGGQEIQASDKKLLLPASGVIPLLRHRVLFPGNKQEWTILGVREDNPAGTPVAYTLHIRK